MKFFASSKAEKAYRRKNYSEYRQNITRCVVCSTANVHWRAMHSRYISQWLHGNVCSLCQARPDPGRVPRWIADRALRHPPSTPPPTVDDDAATADDTTVIDWGSDSSDDECADQLLFDEATPLATANHNDCSCEACGSVGGSGDCCFEDDADCDDGDSDDA